MNAVLRRFASRKFWLAMASLGSAHWLCNERMISDGVYSAVVIATVGAYLTANVTQRAVEK